MSKLQYKALKVLAIGVLASTSLLWGNFYIGIEGGYLGSTSNFEYTTSGTVAIGNNSKDYIGEDGGVANLVIGTEHLFGETQRFGIRWGAYGGYGYTQGKHEVLGKTSMQILSAGAFIDSITNIVHTENFQFGIFGGLGYDFSMLRPKDEIKLGFQAVPPLLEKDTFISNRCDVHSLLVRIGLTTLISKHHRIELIGQVPFDLSSKIASVYYANPAGSIDVQYTFIFERIQGLFSYKYVF